MIANGPRSAPFVFAIDIETACAVKDCPHYGKAMCANDHSLSPWHSEITVIGVVREQDAYASGQPKVYRPEQVFRGDSDGFRHFYQHFYALTQLGGSFTAHNGKFDVLHLSQKIPHMAQMLLNFWSSDTALNAFVWTDKVPPEYLDWYADNKPKESRKAGPHSLKTLAPYLLKVPAFWEVEDKDDDEYVLKDTRYTLQLHKYLEQHMPADQLAFVTEKLLPWTKMLVEAELRGLKLDVAGLLAYRAELEKTEAELKAQLDVLWLDAHLAYQSIMMNEVHKRYELMKDTKAREPRRQVALSRVPTSVSYDSPAQMSWLLGTFYGYDIRSLEGDESTGKEVLIRLASEGKDDVATFLKWRKTQKVLTAFIPSLLALKDAKDGVHPIYNPMGARTGRLSCERPNAQQVPKELKKFFKPLKGKLIGYDQAAIEAKLIAAYTEDPALLDVIASGDSIHNVNTTAFFALDCQPSEVPELYPRQRKASKNVGFALFYHAGANRIRVAITQGGFPISLNDAKRMHKNFLAKFTTALSYAKEVVAELEGGGVIPNLLGRPIKIQNPQDAYMQGFNTLIQSSASDINLDRMHSALGALRAKGIEAYPILTVHDYAGIEVVGDDVCVRLADAVISKELTNMSLPTTNSCITLEVDGGVSDVWN